MITDDPALLTAAAALRFEVFVVEQGVDPSIERDGADSQALHAVIHDDNEAVVATGRLLDAGDHARLGRIAVRRTARGRGLGAAIVTELERVAGRHGLSRIRLHAQQPVVDFYTRLGYLAVGPVDMEAGLPHRWMERNLLPGLRAATDRDAESVQRLIGGCFAEYPGCVVDLDGIDGWMRAPGSSYAAKGGELWIVAETSATVGWVSARHRVELKSLYVAAGSRRRGWGTTLVGLVERTARARGAAAVELWSDTRFETAHRLYAGLGYIKSPWTRYLHDLSDTTEYHFERVLDSP